MTDVTAATVTVTVLDTGFCTTPASLIARGTGWASVRCAAPAFLLEHRVHGALLFDTGYGPRLRDAFAHFPERIYHYATPTTFGIPAVAHLARRGIAAGDVGLIIVSHLHADHVAGLCDFPAARFVVTAAALALQQQVRGVAAIRQGIVQSLFPADFAARTQIVTTFPDTPLPHLGGTHDLFGDGTVHLVPLPGHARGQIGALIRSTSGDLFLAADGAWSTRAWREQRLPHWITSAIQDDPSALRATLGAIRDFAAARPDVRILPTHCPDTMRWGEPA